jgi:hypothetical protein
LFALGDDLSFSLWSRLSLVLGVILARSCSSEQVTSIQAKTQHSAVTMIEIRPFRNGWQVYERELFSRCSWIKSKRLTTLAAARALALPKFAFWIQLDTRADRSYSLPSHKT